MGHVPEPSADVHRLFLHQVQVSKRPVCSLSVYRALFIDLQISCVELHSWKQAETVHKKLLSIHLRKHRVAPVQRTLWLFTHPQIFWEVHLDVSERGKDLLAKVAELLPSLQKDLEGIKAADRR